MQPLRRVPILSHQEPCLFVPEARVSFDRLDRCWPLVVELEGWFLAPQTPFDSLHGFLNGRPLARVDAVSREDVRDTFPWIGHAVGSGFRTQLDPHHVKPDAWNHFDLVGMRNGQPAGKTHTLFHPNLEDMTPAPPAKLMTRVAGHADAATFRLGGLKCFGDFHRAIGRHRDLAGVQRLLDWGCGCGRVIVHFLASEPPLRVSGCDIDAEAVAWCRETFPTGEFTAIQPWPPLPYEDGAFDVLLSYSVFTHLTRQAQAAWLEELKRVLKPGGILVASIHGEFAAAFEWPPEQAAELLQSGIFDQNPDASLEGVVGSDYYQNTFQTREYTLRAWSKHMEIVEYTEAGMNSYQDLVVLRR